MRATGILLSAVLSLVLTGSLDAQEASGPDCGKFKVFGNVETRAFADIGEPGLTAGDQRVGRYLISDDRGKDIGFMHFAGVAMPAWESAESPVMITLHYKLPKGALVATSVVGLPSVADTEVGPDHDLQYAITGGTGDFAHATGTLTTRSLDDGRREMTFDLSCAG